MVGLFNDYVFRSMEQRTQRAEEMVERMLTDPESRGIMMVQDGFTTWHALSPHVPFGHVFEFPSWAAVEVWKMLGYPQ